jgi:hypothetical protein
MADEQSTTPTAAADAAPQAQAPAAPAASTPPAAAQAGDDPVKRANAEAAAYRVKLRDAEKRLAEVEGRTADLQKLREQELAEREAKIVEAQKLVEELRPFADTVRSEVDALRKQLGDKAPPTDGLSDAAAYRILKHTANIVASAGPGAARPTAAGNPPAVAPRIDPSVMTEEQLAAHYASMTPEQRAAEVHGTKPRSPYAWAPPPKR